MEDEIIKKSFESLFASISNAEKKSVCLGIEIEKLRQEFFYKYLIRFLQGKDTPDGAIYFEKLKPLYDRFGYEKINRILLELEKDEKGNGEKSDE